MPTVAQIFARTLRVIGVRFVFGVPSGNMIDYIEALRLEDGIDFVLVGHETTAAFMAGVCGRLTGIPGVCFGTFGPGATNLATGVGGAFLDRFPLVAFTDEMSKHLLQRTVQMNIDHQKLFKPITKRTTRLKREKVVKTILQAARITVSEVPGPVHIGVPAGIAKDEADFFEVDWEVFIQENKTVNYIDRFLLIQIEELLKNAKKPILVIGLSAVRSNVKERVIQIAEKFQFPVVLTPMAKGMFPENHPLYAGVLFHALSNEVAKTYREADLVVAIGYDPVEVNYEDWVPKDAWLVHLDSKEADVDIKQVPFYFNVIADLDFSLKEFLKLQNTVNDWNLTELKNRKNEIFRKLRSSSNSFGPLAVVNELRKVLSKEGILTVDVGAHLHLIGQMWPTPSPEKLLMTNGWSSMGFAIPAALAAKLCHPDLPVAALMGDGGFLMTVGELATAKRLNLKIVFVVIYDNSLSLIRIKQDKKNYNSNYGTDLNDLPEISTNHYFGVPVIRATDLAEYRKALKKAFSLKGPVVIESIVNASDYDQLVLKANE